MDIQEVLHLEVQRTKSSWTCLLMESLSLHLRFFVLTRLFLHTFNAVLMLVSFTSMNRVGVTSLYQIFQESKFGRYFHASGEINFQIIIST